MKAYLKQFGESFESFTPAQQQAVLRQADIGVLQTMTLVIMILQVVFTGVLRLLPPETRAAFAFLHRIEWGVYLTILLIAVQVSAGWREAVVLTNPIGLFAYGFGRPRLLHGRAARIAQGVYILLLVGLVLASIWVRINGFIVQPTN